MPQVSTQEFERLPLRVHAFLAGVPLHDVRAVDLSRTRPGIMLDEFLRTGGARPYTLSPVVRALLSIVSSSDGSWVGIVSRRQPRGGPSQHV